MGRSRRSRRRIERKRAKRPSSVPRLSALARLGIAAAGVLLILAGAGLLTAGGPQTATRLGRVAGIMILLGIVAIAVAAIGHA